MVSLKALYPRVFKEASVSLATRPSCVARTWTANGFSLVTGASPVSASGFCGIFPVAETAALFGWEGGDAGANVVSGFGAGAGTAAALGGGGLSAEN